MNKRYQVFVSSTYKDLSDERMEVVKALLELDCIPCGMEYFPAASEDSWSYISKLIQECDYYVLIVGGRYGSLTKEGISFTQKEYQCAVENRIPVLPFIRADLDSLPVKKVDSDIELRKKLESFINLLRENNLCKEWHNADDLGAVVSRGITQLVKRVPRTGWVRADEYGTADIARVLALTQRIAELEGQIKKYEGDLAIPGVPNLADGDEQVELTFSYAICYDKQNDKSYWPTVKIRSKGRDSIRLTWNKIFATISPKVATGVSTDGVKKSIAERIFAEWSAPKLEHTGDYIKDISLDDFCFDRVRVQFEALRLLVVQREETGKTRSKVVKWHLTERGRRRMIELLAVRTEK